MGAPRQNFLSLNFDTLVFMWFLSVIASGQRSRGVSRIFSSGVVGIVRGSIEKAEIFSLGEKQIFCPILNFSAPGVEQTSGEWQK